MGSHRSTAGDEVRAVLDLLRRIVQALRLSAKASQAGTGLSGAQLFVLSKLADGEALSINALAGRTATHQSSVSVVVSKLVARKLLIRSRSDEDGRLAVVSITPRGRAMLKRAPRMAQDALLRGLVALPPPQRHRLHDLLIAWLGNAGIDTATSPLPAPMFFESHATSTPRRSRVHVRRTRS